MALLKPTRSAQYPLVAEFVFNYNDTMVDTAGVTKTFGSVYTDAGTFEVIPMPPGAVIVGGEVIVQTQGAGPTAYTVAVGNSSTGNLYLAASSLLAADNTRYPFTMNTASGTTSTSSLGANTGLNVRLTIASTVANATAGKFRVRVMYTTDNKANETQIV